MPTLADDLFELVFERLDQAAGEALYCALVGRETQFPADDDGWVQETSLDELVLRPGVVLGDVHLRLLRYEGATYDVELNFRPRQSTASSMTELSEALFGFAAMVATVYGVESYFAGLDPASDQRTRLFTGRVEGPYFHLS